MIAKLDDGLLIMSLVCLTSTSEARYEAERWQVERLGRALGRRLDRKHVKSVYGSERGAEEESMGHDGGYSPMNSYT
jgi:hypothetical protein